MNKTLPVLAFTTALSFSGAAGAGLIAYTANGVDLVYDNDRDLTWVANANLFKTQWDADNTTDDQIITAVVTVAGHNLVLGDFITANGSMTWWGAMAWAQWLDYGGVSDWRLWSALNSDGTDPCGPSIGCSDSELGHLFYTEGGLSAGSSITSSVALTTVFTNMQNSVYWSGTEYAPNADNAWFFNARNGFQYYDDKGFVDYHAWAVRSGRVAAAVPEPASIALVGLGVCRTWGTKPG